MADIAQQQLDLLLTYSRSRVGLVPEAVAALLACVASLTRELADEKLAWEQQRAAYVEMRAERDDALHGRDLARLDTEREREETHKAWTERNTLTHRAEVAEREREEARLWRAQHEATWKLLSLTHRTAYMEAYRKACAALGAVSPPGKEELG